MLTTRLTQQSHDGQFLTATAPWQELAKFCSARSYFWLRAVLKLLLHRGCNLKQKKVGSPITPDKYE
jgi:hypothetical protein